MDDLLVEKGSNPAGKKVTNPRDVEANLNRLKGSIEFLQENIRNEDEQLIYLDKQVTEKQRSLEFTKKQRDILLNSVKLLLARRIGMESSLVDELLALRCDHQGFVDSIEQQIENIESMLNHSESTE